MQTTKTKGIERTQHVWTYREDLKDWKCVICGAVAVSPAALEKSGEAPIKFEKLTKEEREMCPFKCRKV